MVDTTNTTTNYGWEYPAADYDASNPTWPELLNALFGDIDSSLDSEVTTLSSDISGLQTQVNARLPKDGSEAMTGALDMGGYRVDNRTGFLSGYLSTTQSNVEDGAHINVFENLEVSDGPYTKDSATQVTVDRDGRYRITWTVCYNQVGGSDRSCLESFPVVSGTNRTEFKSTCYIRHDTDGSESSTGGEAVFSLTAGDTLRVYTQLTSGINNAHDAYTASATIEYLG